MCDICSSVTNHTWSLPLGMKPLHIVFIDFDDITNPLLSAGQARATLEVGKRLVAKGHRVTVISSKFPGYTDRTQNGIVYKHIGIGSQHIRLNNLCFIAALPWTIRRIHADVIVECFTPPFSTLFTPIWTRVPVVAKPTSFEAERFAAQYHLPFHWVEHMGAKLYRYFIPATHTHAQKMKRLNPAILSHIIPEGVDDSFFTIQRQNPQHILFLGRFDLGQKGIDLLLSAYKHIESHVPYPLVLAGHGPDEFKLRNLIQAYGLAHKVQIVGPAYGEKKRELLATAVCVALPSRQEGFSLFALETMAAGVPLVTFDIPGLAWQGEGVYKAPMFDTKVYAQLLKEVARTPTHSSAAQSFAKHFTWEHTTQQYESFLYSIVLDQESVSPHPTSPPHLNHV